jgi:ribosome-associated heat shock protein Hsp15
VVKVLALATRRGPAPEARELYEDLKPPEAANRLPRNSAQGREPGAGRPTKKDRRALDRLVGES